MGVYDLKVDWEHITPTASGLKWTTFRYPDDTKMKAIGKGDSLRLLDPDGEFFAMAKVSGTFYMEVEHFIRAGFPYYRKYGLEEFLEKMNGYYDDPIDRYTECKGITYVIIAKSGDYFDKSNTRGKTLEDFNGTE